MKHKTSGVDVLLDPESSLRSSLRERVLGKLLQEDRVRINAYREELENYEVERGLLESKRRELDTLEGEVKSTRARLEKDREIEKISCGWWKRNDGFSKRPTPISPLRTKGLPTESVG